MDEDVAGQKQARPQREKADPGINWPQRPPRPQPPVMRPRLDPPTTADRSNLPTQALGDRSLKVGEHPEKAATPAPAPIPGYKPAAPTSPPQPQASAPRYRDESHASGDPKETRAIPLVEPSRFGPAAPQDRRQARIAPGSARPAPSSAPSPAPPPAQPSVQQQHTTPRPAVQAPQPRPDRGRPGGWQYERDEEAYGYAEGPGDEYGYSRSAAMPSIPTGRGKQQPEHGRGYLSANAPARSRRSLRWLGWLVAGLVAILFVVVTAFSLAWQGQYAGKVYAGVSVLGLDLGGKSQGAAERELRDKLQTFLSQPVVLSWHGKEWRPALDQLGLKVDIESTIDEAFSVGRGNDPLANVAAQWRAYESGYRVPVTVQVSEPVMQTYLAGLAQNEIDQKLFEGDVRLNGTQIVAMPGKEGRTLRVYDAIQEVRKSAAKLQPVKIELPVQVVQPSVSADEVSRVQSQMALRMSAPITATIPGKSASLGTDAIVRLTTVERNPDRSAPRHIQLGWKENELKILGDRWTTEFNRPAQTARFAWNNGALSVLKESQDGFETDPQTVIASIKEKADLKEGREYALPGKVITPTVSSKDIGSLGIKELVSSGESTFKGSSAERATNIRVAANLINGAVVPPGGTFSFLQAVGAIDEAHGFVEGYVIAAERTQRGVGGGVCQVSTTVFRAAFWSGSNISERNPHAYRVGWYESNGEPVGFDAAVFDPGVDLKFINDSPSYLLIEASAGADRLVVNFYGTKRPGEVKLEGPTIANKVPPPADVYQVDTRLPPGTKKQVETAHGGLETTITRRIVVPGQPDKVDKFRSVYKAWPNWYIVASPSQIPGGAAMQPASAP